MKKIILIIILVISLQNTWASNGTSGFTEGYSDAMSSNAGRYWADDDAQMIGSIMIASHFFPLATIGLASGGPMQGDGFSYGAMSSDHTGDVIKRRGEEQVKETEQKRLETEKIKEETKKEYLFKSFQKTLDQRKKFFFQIRYLAQESLYSNTLSEKDAEDYSIVYEKIVVALKLNLEKSELLYPGIKDYSEMAQTHLKRLLTENQLLEATTKGMLTQDEGNLVIKMYAEAGIKALKFFYADSDIFKELN